MNEAFETEAVVKLVKIMAYQTLVRIANCLTYFLYRIVKLKDTMEIS